MIRSISVLIVSMGVSLGASAANCPDFSGTYSVKSLAKTCHYESGTKMFGTVYKGGPLHAVPFPFEGAVRENAEFRIIQSGCSTLQVEFLPYHTEDQKEETEVIDIAKAGLKWTRNGRLFAKRNWTPGRDATSMGGKGTHTSTFRLSKTSKGDLLLHKSFSEKAKWFGVISYEDFRITDCKLTKVR